MVNPFAIGAQALKTGVGIAQYFKGQKELRRQQRPEYNIPEGIKENVTQAQLRAQEGLSSDVKAEFNKQADRSLSSGLYGLKDRSLGLRGLTGLTQQRTDAATGLMAANAQQKQANQKDLFAARETLAGYEDQAFGNDLDQYQENVASAQANIGAGMQNAFGGLDSISGLLTSGQGGGNASIPG